MSRTIFAKLVHYGHDGKYVGPPVALAGVIVNDEEHGWVLEIVLPDSEQSPIESAILVSVVELQKLA
ncbi:MAG TPA: hypothetical protein VMA54_20935 [Steroidobacteraceae bacterium]|nr:hypothetical protein [Steroidobacteraceae bacterium]HUA26608.1 hypothetical protein [Steroidobacteraceae bacterium]